jgi:diguanylate cyclase (GGDEF)-like protein
MHSPWGGSPSLFALRLVAAAVTLLLLVWVSLGPERITPVHPVPGSVLNGYDDSETPTGKSRNQWSDRSKFALQCELNAGADYPYCGTSVKFYKQDPGFLIAEGNPVSWDMIFARDLSDYRGLLIDVGYQGAASKFRVSLRSSLSGDTTPNLSGEKFQHVWVYSDEISDSKPLYIPFEQFSVADWWVEKFQIRRDSARPEFSKIIEISVNLAADAPKGQHVLELRNVSLVGDWIPPRTIYFAISGMWLLLIFAEVVQRYRLALKDIKVYRRSLTTLEQTNASLRHDANLDALTKVFNRRGIEEFYKVLRASETSDGLAVGIFDIDNFKAINDRHGHLDGDRVLAQFANILSTNCREGDIVGRWGGEEFILISRHRSLAKASLAFDRFRQLIAEASIALDGNQHIRISCSGGVTLLHDQEDISAALGRADQALYQAKKTGKNKIVSVE